MLTENKDGVNTLVRVSDEDLIEGVFTIPNEVVAIASTAFTFCDNLTDLIIPSSVRGIIKVCPFPALGRLIVDSDIDEEVERIRGLFSEHLQGYVLSKSTAALQKQAVKQIIDEFRRLCFDQDTQELKLQDEAHTHKRVQPLLPMISELLGKPAASEYYLKAAIAKIPYPKTSADLADYTLKLQDIQEQHVNQYKERHIAISELDKYIRTLEKADQNGFFMPPKVSARHQTLKEGLEKIITFLQEYEDGARCELSAEEKEEIMSRPVLLKKIPPEIQEKSGLHKPDIAPAVR